MTTATTSREPWDDARLRAAFAARALRASTPADLADTTVAALQSRPADKPVWRRLLAPVAVAAVIVIAVTSGFAMLRDGERGATGMFRDGPTPDLKTFDSGEFAFEYPAKWLGYVSSAAFSGGSSIAVLGTQAVESRCGDVAHVDINCVYEQRLEPGDIRVFIGTGAFRGGTVLDRPDIENGATTRHTVAGMPAIRDEHDPRPDSFYREDLSLQWSIGRPGLLSNVIRIELRARNAAGSAEVVAEAHAALEAAIASFRFHQSVAPSPTEPPVGSEAAGLPVVSVDAAIAIRDASADDHEIAVRAWFPAYAAASRACGRASDPPVSPLQATCADELSWLMQDREQLITVTSSGLSWRGPTGRAISPEFDDVDMSWAFLDDDPAHVFELVVIGHFDDPGARRCPAADRAACADRFVVDRIDSIDGVEQPLSVVERMSGAKRSSPDDIRTAVQVRSPQRPILSMVVLDAAEVERLPDGPSETVWIAKVLGPQMLEHHIVFDGADEVFEVQTSGPPTFPVDPPDPEPTPSPAPAWGPWPPQDAFTVLEFKDETGEKPRVAVVDDSGWLVAINDVAGGPAIGTGEAEGFFRDPSGEHRYRLRWTTSICDREMTLVIEHDLARIAIAHAPRDGCDAQAIGRELLLEFSRDVDPAEVELEVIPATLLPEDPPEPTTMVVQLARFDATEDIVVIDHGGSLMEARPATEVPAISELIGVQIVRADDGGTIVLWDGALCDRDLWLSIEADDLGPPDRIVVHGTRSEPCRSALIRRAIWLDLGPVDVGAIDGQSSMSATSEGQIDAGPEVSVAGALVIQSLPGDDRTLQARGWYWRDPAVYDCFVPPSPPPVLESGCQGPRDRLLIDPAHPTGPGFSVWLRPGVATPAIPLADPGEVVMVGHFDDELAEDCAAATLGACRDVFVVEEVIRAAAP